CRVEAVQTAELAIKE
ncbi:hypothetical protein ACIOVC_27745, partial [Pseudomonas neuropathica]